MSNLPKRYTKLRPPVDCLSWEPSGDEIFVKTGDSQKPVFRKVFFVKNATVEEETALKTITDKLSAKNVDPPKWWKTGDSLRFLHDADWDLELAEDKITTHLKWLETLPNR